MCKNNLPYGTVVYDCKIGFIPGKIHPDMDPRYLALLPWWKEPAAVQAINTHSRYIEVSHYGHTLYASVPYYPHIVELD